MRGLGRRTGWERRSAAALAVTFALALSASPTRAADGGFFGFLSSLTGDGPASPPAPAQDPAASDAGGQSRPLTVRRGRKKPAFAHAGPGPAKVARLPARSGPISIYEDPTLRSGDAVMTKDGMRVFAGGHLSPDHPYGDADFVAVSASRAVGPNLKKTVIEINKLPHS